MKKRKNLVQKTLTIAAIASMGTTFAIASPGVASADQINTSGEHGVLAVENTPTSVNKNAVGITDVQSDLKKMGEYYYNNTYAGKKVDHRTYAYKPDSFDIKMDFSITDFKVGDLKYDTTNLEYLGENIFNNPTELPQQRVTSKYTKTIQDSITTTTTKGFKVGGDVSNIFSIPIILSNGMKLNAEFNASSTEAKTKSESRTIEASPQTTTIPPGKTYKVEVLLAQRNYWADVTFTGEAKDPRTTIKTTASYTAPNGMIDSKKYTFENNASTLWYGLTDSQRGTLNGIGFRCEFTQVGNTVLHQDYLQSKGTARVEGIYGSLFTVNTWDITDPSNPKLVNRDIVE